MARHFRNFVLNKNLLTQVGKKQRLLPHGGQLIYERNKSILDQLDGSTKINIMHLSKVEGVRGERATIARTWGKCEDQSKHLKRNNVRLLVDAVSGLNGG